MYTKSYYESGIPITVPKNYDGTAFVGEEPAAKDDQSVESHTFQEEIDEKANESEPTFLETNDRKSQDSLFGFPNCLSSMRGIFTKGNGGIFSSFTEKIGTEEILLIVIAAVLLLSKSHDIESALMLCFLVFIK